MVEGEGESAVVTDSSEQPAAPGGAVTPPKAAGSEIDSASEAEKKPVVAEPEDKAKPPNSEKPEEHEPSRGKFKAEKQKLRDQISALREELDVERGSKTKLREKLEAAETQLAGLNKPADEAKPQVEALAKPKRPQLKDFEFDDDLYQAALEKYDEDLGEYHAKKAATSVQEALAKNERETAERQQKAEADRIFNEFVAKRSEGAVAIEDYDDMLEAAGDYKLPARVEIAIIESSIPAQMIHFFNRDKVENGGKEMARIASLSEDKQIRELTLLEVKLSTDGQAPAKPVKKEKPAAAPVVDEAPPAQAQPAPVAQPKQIAVPEPPLEPLGSRTTGRTPMLGEAKDAKEYMRLRAQGVNR